MLVFSSIDNGLFVLFQVDGNRVDLVAFFYQVFVDFVMFHGFHSDSITTNNSLLLYAVLLRVNSSFMIHAQVCLR